MHCIFHIVEQNPLVEIDTSLCLHDDDIYGSVWICTLGVYYFLREMIPRVKAYS